MHKRIRSTDLYNQGVNFRLDLWSPVTGFPPIGTLKTKRE